MTTVLLATFDLLPDGERGGDLLPPALARRGIEARWVSWSDDTVDWAGADLVAVRSTWDYHRRLPEFLAWAERVGRQVPLLNGADVFAWNADKAYLLDLAVDLPVVPSRLVDDTDLAVALAAALAEHGEVVLKPRTGAGGVGLVVAARTDDPRLADLGAGPWLLQPVVASVRTTGERSLFVLDGAVVSQVDKVAPSDDLRVHPQYGGSSRPVPLDPAAVDLAERATAWLGERFGRPLPYARVDLLEVDGALAVSEVELIEPGLYLDLVPGNAEAFADVVVGALGAASTAP